MNRTELSELVQQTEIYKGFDAFKKKLTLSKTNTEDLIVLFNQDERYGIDYLKLNSRLQSSTVKLIEQCLNLKHK